VQIGGGVHVGDALPSDCRFKTHSNMGTVVLCLNVSGRDIRLVWHHGASEKRKQETDRQTFGGADEREYE